MNKAQLQKQLAEEALKVDPDNDKLLQLSNQIAQLDESKVRFSVDAGIINRLGKELVGRHETAVAELVKNAYDADATVVSLTFEDADVAGGNLYIEDNGSGMDWESLIQGFMRLSSADKINNPKSIKYQRSRSGRKGIGRFAAQCLGTRLTIVTQVKSKDYALSVDIDWARFESDMDLFSISNEIKQIPKEKDEGTTLIIHDLRDKWTEATIKRVYRYTADLLQPFPLSEHQGKDADINDPGFKSAYYRKNSEGTVLVVDDFEAFFKHALAEIEGYVLEDGEGCWALKSDKLNFPQEVFQIGKNEADLGSNFEFIRGLHFKCYYFIYGGQSQLPAGIEGFIKKVAYERGGIRLYRNGFRVSPYGENNDDWLGLDESSARRMMLGSHRNINFFGFVELGNSLDHLFEETSSREGLIENDAFKELIDFVYRSIVSATLKVSELRGRKGKASQKNHKPASAQEEVDDALSDLEKAVGKKVESVGDNDQGAGDGVGEAISNLRVGVERQKQETQALIEELNMLRILAALGLVIGEFVHEVKRYFPAYDIDLSFLKNHLEADPDTEEAKVRIDRLEANIKGLSTYTSYFDNAISRNVLRELEPIEIRDAVNSLVAIIQNDLSRSEIDLQDIEYRGYDLFTIPMHPSEWASILFNLYTNSKKAIKKQCVDGDIYIKCGRENKMVYLEFSDNGCGIPNEDEEHIFNAFFTTSPAAGHGASDLETLTGTGLGLKIVRDIIESYNGTIEVVQPKEGYSTTIRLEIPENNNEADNDT